MDDDIHFGNEERKKKLDWVRGVVVLKGGRKSSSGGEEGEEKKCFAWLQSKQAEEDSVFFRLRLAAAVTDGLCMRISVQSVSVYVAVHVVTGLIRQHFLGTQEDVGEGPCGS